MIEHGLVILIRGDSILNEKLISNEGILHQVFLLDLLLLDPSHSLVGLPLHLLLSVKYLQSLLTRWVLCWLVKTQSALLILFISLNLGPHLFDCFLSDVELLLIIFVPLEKFLLAFHKDLEVDLKMITNSLSQLLVHWFFLVVRFENHSSIFFAETSMHPWVSQ